MYTTQEGIGKTTCTQPGHIIPLYQNSVIFMYLRVKDKDRIEVRANYLQICLLLSFLHSVTSLSLSKTVHSKKLLRAVVTIKGIIGSGDKGSPYVCPRLQRPFYATEYRGYIIWEIGV